MTTPNDEARLRRLPNYARVEIDRLRRENDDLRLRLGDGPKASVAYLSNGYGRPATPLGDHPQVSWFRTAEEAAEDVTWGRLDVRLDHQDGRTWLRIMGSRGLLIAPQVTNVIHVTQEGW